MFFLKQSSKSVSIWFTKQGYLLPLVPFIHSKLLTLSYHVYLCLIYKDVLLADF